MVAKGERVGRGMDWEFGVSRCKLLHLEWINNRVLLYSTGNYIQSPRINLNGKEYKKECMTVVENLPANAGDTGSSPGLGGSHMPRSD